MWLIGFRNEVFRFIDRRTGNALAVGLEMYFKEIKIYYNNNMYIICVHTLYSLHTYTNTKTRLKRDRLT